MLSLELAKRLKELGLEWEPQRGDQYRELLYKRLTQIYDADPKNEYRIKDSVWLPRLDQLLAEIEKRGYAWELSVDEADKPPYAICFFSTPREIGQKWFTADSPEEAAAKALIWILEQEGAN